MKSRQWHGLTTCFASAIIVGGCDIVAPAPEASNPLIRPQFGTTASGSATLGIPATNDGLDLSGSQTFEYEVVQSQKWTRLLRSYRRG